MLYNDQQWYDPEVSDTTMMTIAASLLGQKEFLSKKNLNHITNLTPYSRLREKLSKGEEPNSDTMMFVKLS